MAVITKFFIVRNGVELDMVFEDKKEADAYDKMLDAAESLAVFIKQGEPAIGLDEKAIDDISVFLAKNAGEVTNILKGIKRLMSAEPAEEKPKETVEEKPKKPETEDAEPAVEKKVSGRKAGTGSKQN